jgi:outer membrane receptor protein involved in Fe transport
MEMKRFFSAIFLTVACTLIALGQSDDEHIISGTIVDENNEPVPFANAALYNRADSALVTGAVSTAEGQFRIPVGPGQYYLKITFLSYEEKTIPRVDVTAGDVNLGTIVLRPGQQLLEEVTVQSERSSMELYLDKRIFNVGKDLTNISGSASDILDNVPSVTVDVDGNVSLRGSENVRILINGKPSGLTGISTADALQQIQANLIESVEVITNPSSRYDAEGEVGIINIILKKEERQGVNGAFTLNAGHPDNYGGSFTLNLRRDKFNLFSSYGFRYRSSPGTGNSFQQFTQPDTSFSYYQENTRRRGGVSHNLMAGVDYYFNESSILTGSVNYRKSDGLNKSSYIFRDFDENGALIRTVTRNEREEEPEDNAEFALSFRKDYGPRNNHYLTADFKWIENVETEYSTFLERDEAADTQIDQRASNTENERNILFQLDFVKPFGQRGKIEAGAKSTLRVIDNDFLVEQLTDESTWETVGEFDNRMVYTENIHAAYAIFGNEVNRFSYQFGLRGELTDVSVELSRENKTTYQNYFNVFPSSHLAYRITDSKTVQLSYTYRLSRPWFRSLMPFSNYSNNRTLYTGNPDLKPEYTHSIEGGYLFDWESGSILSSVYYRHRTGVVNRITIVDSIGYNRIFPVNLSTQDAVGLEFNFNWEPTSWWRITSNANFYRAVTKGQYEGQILNADTYTLSARAMSRITFLKKYDFQTSWRYRAPRETTQGRMRSNYAIDLGLSRDVLAGRGTVTVSVRDLFNTNKFREIIDDEDFYSESESQWRPRSVMFTFNYRINRKKDSERNQRQQEGGEGMDNGFEQGQGGGDF